MQKDLRMEYLNKALIMFNPWYGKLIKKFIGNKTIFLHFQKRSQFTITFKQRKPYKLYIKIDGKQKIHNKKSPCKVKRN